MTEIVRAALIQKIAGACQEWRSSNENFARIQQGTEAWNQWRKANPQARPDLSGLDLSAMDLKGIDFSRAKLTRTDLTGTDLTGANFSGADLGQCILNGATLMRANLKDADLIWAKLVETDLSYADLTRAKCIECEGIGSQLRNATLRDAKLSRSSFMDADFSDSDLMHIKALETNFNDAKLCRVNMTGGVAIGADFWQVDFSNSVLARADLSSSNLSKACLSGTNCTGVNLEETQLRGAILDGAQVTGACVFNWVVDDIADLSLIECEYIYLESGFQGRYPHGQEQFQPGQFAATVREGAETIEMIFDHGINWLAFLQVLKSLPEELNRVDTELKAFEQLDNGGLKVRLEVRSVLKAKEIKSLLDTKYRKMLVSVEEHYQTDLGWSGELLAHYQSHCGDLMEIARIVASYRPSSSRKRRWANQAMADQAFMSSMTLSESASSFGAQ
ncbi:MAG: pentapeptide repeat-containing protein [Cyanobacteria bacterium P01_C01_bin.89]